MSSTHRSGRFLVIVSALALALGIAACGGGGSNETPSDVAVNFYKALSKKDTSKACSYISDEAKKSAEAAGGCEKALDQKVATIKPALLAAFGSLKAGDEKITGDTATVGLTPTARGYTSGHQTANLVKQDGDWKLVDFKAG